MSVSELTSCSKNVFYYIRILFIEKYYIKHGKRKIQIWICKIKAEETNSEPRLYVRMTENLGNVDHCLIKT